MKTSKKVLLMLSMILTLVIIAACGNNATDGTGDTDDASPIAYLEF